MNFLIIADEISERRLLDFNLKTFFITVAIFCLWFRLFYWMRVFEEPAFFFFMIKKTLTGIGAFLILLAIILLLFANMTYVLNIS